MPIHDWTRVAAGIFHDFHHAWIEEIKRVLNQQLPLEYYALAEQTTGGFRSRCNHTSGPSAGWFGFRRRSSGRGSDPGSPEDHVRCDLGCRILPPEEEPPWPFATSATTGWSPWSRSSRPATRRAVARSGPLLDKACVLLENRNPPDADRPVPADQAGPGRIHAAIWAEVEEGSDFRPPSDKPLTVVSYEAAATVTAYIEPVAVGDVLPDMPLFLEPGLHVAVPLETTYEAAFAAGPAAVARLCSPRPGTDPDHRHHDRPGGAPVFAPVPPGRAEARVSGIDMCGRALPRPKRIVLFQTNPRI